MLLTPSRRHAIVAMPPGVDFPFPSLKGLSLSPLSSHFLLLSPLCCSLLLLLSSLD